MKQLTITSLEALDSFVAEVVRTKILLTKTIAKKEGAVAELEKRHQSEITAITEKIAAMESVVLDYCTAHRAELFSDKKSRETSLAEFGFEFTPHRVETASRKIKWKDVVERLQRLSWGKAYVRNPDPQPDKQALLSDREKLSPEQLTAAGVQFCQDEQFFIRPKPETAADTVKEAA
jgi:phage host-nuclease inhibitor protein Gam